MSPIIAPEYPDFSAGPLPAPTRPPDTIEELNPRVLVYTIVGLLALLPTAFLWHQFQIYRNSGKLLAQAERLADQEDWRASATMYFHYLKLRPDDAKSWVRLAQTFDRAAKTYNEKQKAVELYFQTVTLASDQSDLRRRLAELLLELGKHHLAEYQADQLLERLPEDGGAWRTKALASYWTSRTTSRVAMQTVAKAFTNAAKYNPHDVVMSRGLAEIYRKELQNPGKAERESFADTVMNKLVAANPNNTEALLSRYTYRVRFRLPEADPDLNRAIELAPDDIEVLLASAHRSMQRRDYAAAQRDYQRLAELFPSDGRGYLGWGQALALADQRDRALEVWRQGLQEAGADDFWINLRMTEALIVLGRLDQASGKLLLLDDLAAGQKGRAKREERQRRLVAIDFVRARWFAAKGDFYSAVPVLQRVLSLRQRTAETDEDLTGVVEVLYQLAQAYAAQQQFDLAAGMFDEAVRLQPTVAEHHINAAQAWESAGQFERAGRSYEMALVQKSVDPSAQILLARTQLARQQRLPPALQNWDEVRATLTRAKERRADSATLKLLEADYLSASGRREEALRLLEAALQQFPRNARLAQALVMAHEKWGRPEEADRLLAEMREADRGSDWSLRMLQTAVYVHRQEFDRARALLQEAVEKGGVQQRSQAQFQLVRIDLKSNNLASARQRLEELTKANPRNPVLWEMLAELAMGEADWDQAQMVEQRLRDLQGPTGTDWRYFRAVRLLETARGTNDDQVAEAERLQQEVQDLRPAWAQGYHLRGMVRQTQQRWDEAIEAYQQAVHLGHNNLRTYQQLIALLQRRNRVAEADRYLAQLIDLASYVPQLSTLAVTVSFQQGQLGRAVKVAEEAVAQRPEDPAAHTMLGTSLLLVGRAADGQRALERANELAPDDPQTWMGLLAMHVRQEHTDQVRQLAERLTAAPLPEAVRAFLAGQAFELVGDADAAQRQFLRALEAAPEDLSILDHTAKFMQTRDAAEAERLLRKLVDLAPDAETGKRRLAEFLASAPGEKRWEEVAALLKELGETPAELTPGALRDKARLLVKRSGAEDLREATQLMEHLVRSEDQVLPEDRLALAWLYTIGGQTAKARDQYRELATQPEPAAAHVAAYAGFLIDHEYITEAGSYLTMYEKADPDGALSLELRARWLHAQDRDDEIAPFVDAFVARRLETVSSQEQRSSTYKLAAEACALVNLPAAETWFRRWLELDPAALTPLAVWLASPAIGRRNDAIELCRGYAQQDQTPTSAIAAAAAMVTGNATPSEFEKLEPLLTAAVAAHSDHADLALWVANVRCMQNRAEEAVQHYRRVLALEPDHVDAHSNLALLLSESPAGRDEALRLVERAMAIAGRTVPLVDTYAVVLLRAGRPEESQKLLGQLTQLTLAGAGVHFHLAAARAATGDGDGARRSLKQARQMELDKACLTPGERSLLAKLDQSLTP